MLGEVWELGWQHGQRGEGLTTAKPAATTNETHPLLLGRCRGQLYIEASIGSECCELA